MSEEVHWQRSFYEDKSVRWETPWVNSEIHGVQKSFNEDGTLERYITWVNGKIIGV